MQKAREVRASRARCIWLIETTNRERRWRPKKRRAFTGAASNQ
ncbi:hypothetical protein C4K37_4092 [Pseudomonas chlororaphis subsp. piscium]|nr:hypothetical protein C4K37_4092 [Pseudomonas chlororaphis subsp. piscium]